MTVVVTERTEIAGIRDERRDSDPGEFSTQHGNGQCPDWARQSHLACIRYCNVKPKHPFDRVLCSTVSVSPICF